MPAVVALAERRPAIETLRRSLSRSEFPLKTARSPAHLEALLQRQWFDAIIIGPEAARGQVIDALRHSFPGMPVLVHLPLRSGDATLLERLHRERVAAIVVEGLDEPCLEATLANCGLTGRRLADLMPIAERLDLTDRLQQLAWPVIIAHAPARLDTATLATHLGVSREALSRGVAAGAAPSL